MSEQTTAADLHAGDWFYREEDGHVVMAGTRGHVDGEMRFVTGSANYKAMEQFFNPDEPITIHARWPLLP